MQNVLQNKLVKFLRLAAALVLGNFLIALDVSLFVGPAGIIMGGSTGIALTLRHYFALNTAVGVLIFNILFLLLGTVAIGKSIFFASAASSLLYPLVLGVVEKLPLDHYLVSDPLLATIAGGALLGISAGMILRVGASTGGSDNLALALHKWTHLPTASLLTMIDVLILLLQALFSGFEQILYGIIFTLISNAIVNKMLLLGQPQLQLFVVSEKIAEIRHMILYDLNMGATMIQIETGISSHRDEGLLSVIHPRSLHLVTESIQKIDPNAFLTIIEAKEVRGQGFTADRITYPYK